MRCRYVMSLYKGIFWIKNIDNYDSIAIKELCDNIGGFLKPLPIELLSKSGEDFNHKMAWSTLNKTKTENKPRYDCTIFVFTLFFLPFCLYLRPSL